MNAKQRLTISLVSLCALAMCGLVFCITWMVYLRYAVFTNINGQFKANKVMGEISANVFFAGEIQNMTTNGDPSGAKKIIYSGNETGAVRRLCVPGDRVFQLSDVFTFLVIEYKFKNTSPNDEWLICLDMDLANQENIDITIAYFENAGITDFSMIREKYDDEYIKNLPVATNGVEYVYIKIAIMDRLYSADFEANMNWDLSSRSYLYGN